MKKKVYIAGCGGMLGKAFYNIWSKDYIVKCSDIDLNESWLSYLDFRDFEKYRSEVQEFQPDLLIHLGAYTDLEYCENNEEQTYLTNTISVEHAVRIANELNIPVLYISTAGIFDGSKQTFDDWSEPNPLGIYARTKYLGERYVVENANIYYIFRAGWMMGGGPDKDKKFIGKLLRQIKDGKKTLSIVNDKMGTPTFTNDFASNAKEVFENSKSGLYNLVCQGLTSRYEVAEYLVNLLNKKYSLDIKINIVDSSFFKNQYFAPRPESEQLINKRLNLYGLNKMREWDVCLQEYILGDWNDYLQNLK